MDSHNDNRDHSLHTDPKTKTVRGVSPSDNAVPALRSAYTYGVAYAHQYGPTNINYSAPAISDGGGDGDCDCCRTYCDSNGSTDD
jgi:hypothetical protein